jgi:hypothetical protein
MRNGHDRQWGSKYFFLKMEFFVMIFTPIDMKSSEKAAGEWG